MNIPSKIKISNFMYDVILSDEVLLLDHRECSGMISYEKHEIKINNSTMDMQNIERTFLHEILHGIEVDRELDLGEHTEHIIDQIAIGLHQIILDNPEIFLAAKEVVL